MSVNTPTQTEMLKEFENSNTWKSLELVVEQNKTEGWKKERFKSPVTSGLLTC